MYSIRKWIFRPKKSDNSHLAQFFYADEELNLVAAELDSFDGRKDPERCTSLVNQLRLCQDKVLNIIEKIMNDVIPTQRANRDFRVKFPDDVLQESLAGQLWFGAECLAAGSSIMNREVESASMRPLAKALTRHLDFLRSALRDQCLKNQNDYTDKITNALKVFDRLFAEFELSYVSAMVPVKTMKEYDLLQEVVVLFCEAVQRATRLKLLSQNQIDDYDPALMFTIPRLAIVCGLLVYPEGPLNPDMDPMNMSEMFRPFQTLLYKIRELLWTLSKQELWLLEKSLCSTDDPSFSAGLSIEEQLNSINTDCDAKQKLSLCVKNHEDDPEPCKVSQSGSEYSNESCVMSHSISTNTIVDSPDAVSSDSEEKLPSGNEGSPVTEGDSLCAGQAAEGYDGYDDLDQVPECSGIGTRRLRHSQSWPEAARKSQRSPRSPQNRGAADVDCAASMEILEDVESEPQSLPRCTHSTGSREFCFHLPRNTGREDGERTPSVPSISLQEPDTPGQQIILTENSTLKDNDHADEGQISFVTDTLNQVFLTDPNFKGVLVSEWNQRPRSRSRSKNRKDKERKHSKADLKNGRKKSRVCRAHAELNSQSSANCDNGNTPSSCEALSADPTSLESSIDLTQNVKQNQDTQSSNKSKALKTRVLETESKQNTECLSVPRLHRMKPIDSVNCSRSHSPNLECDWDRESYSSSETSSYNSDSHDDEEIALAIQAAELAARQEARGRFKSSADLIHRLFVCISGVADQLQTNYASDLRHILKTVFDCAATECIDDENELVKQSCDTEPEDSDSTDSEDDYVLEEGNQNPHINSSNESDPPEWMPDEDSPHCLACKVPFTFVRRRHHCRNCGKIFCGRCSSNSVPLPHYGHTKPVRVCNHCFVFQVTPFTVE